MSFPYLYLLWRKLFSYWLEPIHEGKLEAHTDHINLPLWTLFDLPVKGVGPTPQVLELSQSPPVIAWLTRIPITPLYISPDWERQQWSSLCLLLCMLGQASIHLVSTLAFIPNQQNYMLQNVGGESEFSSEVSWLKWKCTIPNKQIKTKEKTACVYAAVLDMVYCIGPAKSPSQPV